MNHVSLRLHEPVIKINGFYQVQTHLDKSLQPLQHLDEGQARSFGVDAKVLIHILQFGENSLSASQSEKASYQRRWWRSGSSQWDGSVAGNKKSRDSVNSLDNL